MKKESTKTEDFNRSRLVTIKRILCTCLVVAVPFGLSLIRGASNPNPLPDYYMSDLPKGLSSMMPIPEQNPLTKARVALGKKLFQDPVLSQDGSIACDSCHQPENGFADKLPKSVGIHHLTGRRNTPSLLNVGFGNSMFWDGRETSLEAQALVPITNPVEMGSNLDEVIARLESDTTYPQLFAQAFGKPKITSSLLAQALASFQRTLVAGNSRFDRQKANQDLAILTETERRGLALFEGKAKCSHCHHGELFTDHAFHNTGVSWGNEPFDLGRFEWTRKPEDKGKFKTPTLRNLVLTPPYMHDGSLETLEEVVDHYDQGGMPNPLLNPMVHSLNLSSQEKLDLVAFLKTLTSETISFPDDR